MIMHLANLGVGIPGMEAMGGQPGITETEAAWFALSLRALPPHWVKVKNPKATSSEAGGGRGLPSIQKVQ